MNVQDLLKSFQSEQEQFLSNASTYSSPSINVPLQHSVSASYDEAGILPHSASGKITSSSLLSTVSSSKPSHRVSRPRSYSTVANVVPLIAARVSLPDSLRIVPLQSVLPAFMASDYHEASRANLLRPAMDKFTMDMSHPLHAPRIAGSRKEYVKLIGRLRDAGMIAFTSRPAAVNGVFTVEKDDDSDRLIIDAQPANRCFIDSPHVQLPDPSCLVQLQIPTGATLYTAKSDLSNFYHHLGLPEWMQPYFCLPQLSSDELESIGLDTCSTVGSCYPMCLTLPMGFSHAVYLAQSVHEHVLYSSNAVPRDTNILHIATSMSAANPLVHGIYIDDFFQFSLSYDTAVMVHEKVLLAYWDAGFIVKQSKVVAPTSAPVKIIGTEVCGDSSVVQLPLQSQMELLAATCSVLRCGRISGHRLSQLIGSWTWSLLLRRPALAILQHTYRFIEISRRRKFVLWPSVKRELMMLLGILPLLYHRLNSSDFHRVIATDASNHGVGVVSTPLSASINSAIWSLCSTSKSTALQILSHRWSASLSGLKIMIPAEVQAIMSDLQLMYSDIYDGLASCHWSVIMSKAWVHEEHINLLELRAVLLALHWILSYPSSITSRAYCLVDSAVTFFSIWKGRSSSPLLLLLIRKINALLLASGIGLLCGWIPSEYNPADGPSRGVH
jgi:hypothetical protein